MHYDVLAESLRLLEGPGPAPEARVSRRRRSIPVAVDRDGDVAATLILRRGISGRPVFDLHGLELVQGSWRVLGGGSGEHGDPLGPRARLADGAQALTLHGGAGISRSTRGLLGARAGAWISMAQLRVAEEVAALQIGDRRLPVAPHGLAVVVWTGRRRPEVAALDASGGELARASMRYLGP